VDMPAKKKKKTSVNKTVRKKTPLKKKRVSSRAKRKPAKKKAISKKKKAVLKPKKKTSTKKSPKKKVSRKKTVKKTLAVAARKTSRKPGANAHIVHNKVTRIEYPLQKKTLLSKDDLVNKFSFPQALMQVRDKVESDDDHEPQLAENLPESIRLEAKQREHQNVSPYVLDLKNRKTLVQSHRVSPKKEMRFTQPSLGLFEEEPGNLVDKMHGLADSFVSHFAPKRRINLLQLERNPRTNHFLRLSRRFSLVLSQIGDACSKPIRLLTDKRRQDTLKLNLSHSSAFQSAIESSPKKVPLLVAQTRSGEPIKVQKLSKTIAKARGALADASGLVHLSDMLEKRKMRTPLEIFGGLSWKKAFVPFATLSLMLLLPFAGSQLYASLTKTQGQVFGAADKAVNKLQLATEQVQSFKFIEASATFDEASQTFLAASALIENQHGFASDLLAFAPIIGDQVQAGKDILAIGNELSDAAVLLSQGVAVLSDPQHFLAEQPLSYKLEYLFVRLEEAGPLISSANAQLSEIDPLSIPAEVRGDIELLQKTLPVLDDQLKQVNKLAPVLLSYLGHDTLQRYLVVFQNNTELRATGGFMGSLALVDLDRAEIQAIDIPGGGPYDYQGSYYDYVAAPRALQLINPRWEFQDTNWFYDWPTSAQKVASVYEKAGGPSVDGVVALNTNVLEALLEFIGPVYLEAYEREFTAQDFRDTLQTYVEFEYDEDLNQPKKIIADLAPILLDEIKDLPPKEFLALASELSTLLQQKDVMVYHGQEDIQSQFSELGWSGEVVETDRDYLAIVHTNLAGGKTDGVIDDAYDLSTHISEAGSVEHTLTISRQHNGVKGVPLLGVRNVDYLRVYVPNGAHLVSASGFELPPSTLFEAPEESWQIDPLLADGELNYQRDEVSGTETYTEGSKTVFANWVQTDPGQTTTVKLVYTVPREVLISYHLPERDASWTDWITGDTAQQEKDIYGYQLLWQKQSGAWTPEMEMHVNYPYDWQIQASTDASGTQELGNWSASAEMNSDSVWSFLFF
jgi:hypothetical protein